MHSITERKIRRELETLMFTRILFRVRLSIHASSHTSGRPQTLLELNKGFGKEET
jgi:hypothetical protein